MLDSLIISLNNDLSLNDFFQVYRHLQAANNLYELLSVVKFRPLW